MEQRVNLHLRSKIMQDPIPDFVITAALEGVRRALREIVQDRREQSKSKIDEVGGIEQTY